jgi:futalosine hydrolase
VTRLLVCAATELELECFPAGREGVVRAVSGVGIVQTLLRLPPLLVALRPEAVLNIGIAGAYPECGVAIGDLVWAESEVFGDVGFELPDGSFQSVAESPFGAGYEPLTLTVPDGKTGLRGCTVSTCTGTRATGEQRRELFSAHFETMEGAAVALACQEAGVLAGEVRSISNIAAERDMRPENIKAALRALKEALQTWP